MPALKADSDIFTTFEGDNTVLMLWIGRQLLADAERTTRTDPVAPTGTKRKAFDRLSYLFVQRERMLVEEVQTDLARLKAEGLDIHAALGQQQVRLLAAAHAYVERVAMESFSHVSATLWMERETGLGLVLGFLNQLFVLSLLEQYKGWYLENGLVTPEDTRLWSGIIDHLCATLAPHAEALVDAFGIPDQCLAAPIAGITLPEP